MLILGKFLGCKNITGFQKRRKVWLCGEYMKNTYLKHVCELPRWLSGKESACNAGDASLTLDREDPLEKEMASHSSILAWEIPWTEESGGL